MGFVSPLVVVETERGVTAAIIQAQSGLRFGRERPWAVRRMAGIKRMAGFAGVSCFGDGVHL
jgi:hypothetical protein